MAGFSSFPDVFSWIQNLPPIQKWEASSKSINLCPSSSSPQPCLKLSLTNLKNTHVSLSIIADYNLPVSLWTSKKTPISKKLLDPSDSSSSTMLCNIIEDVLKYCSNKAGPSYVKLPKTYPQANIGETFNFSFLSLTFVVCVYEAPADLRGACLHALKEQLACPKSRGVSKLLMRQMGTNIEERWMRSMNLAITNWIAELQAAKAAVEAPSPLFSYSFSMLGMWKVQLYCPVIAMVVDKSNGPAPDDRLAFSLNYNQLEGVIQLNYRVSVQEKWIEVRVNTDNIRYIYTYNFLLCCEL